MKKIKIILILVITILISGCSYKELNDCKNKYNTRCSSNTGLPIGPICNPGIESIEATINPDKHEYYYFVTDCNGKVYLTKNSTEHNNIINKLKKEDNWAMDYEDIEKKIIKHNIHFAIFCSPHNPTGRVWKKEEIQKFMDICKKHDVLVFSDEIWSDLVRKENTHIPTQSISEDAKKRTIAAYAPSKTFNLAGLVGSYHIVYDKYLRDRLNKQASLSHYNSPNILSVHALMGAYCKEGLDWVNELNEVISNNIDYALDFIHNNFKGIEVIKPEGTYMLYLDCTKYLDTHDITMDELLKKGVHYGVCWQDGRPFMNPNTIRMNLALPTILVEEAFSRLKKFVF